MPISRASELLALRHRVLSPRLDNLAGLAKGYEMLSDRAFTARWVLGDRSTLLLAANLSGQPPAQTAEEVVEIFGNQLDLVLDGGPRRGAMPSTLVDVSQPRPRLLRRGVIDVRDDLGDFEDLSESSGG